MNEIVDIILHNDDFPCKFIYHGKEVLFYDRKNCFQEIEIKGIDELLLFSTSDIEYSFRGHASKEWKFKTTIERFFENKKLVISKHNIEQKILQKFYSESSTFTSELGYDPKSQKPLDALADIQHHGGPTRLLDFTSSFNIALFFATFNNFATDSAVYCLRNLMFNTVSLDIRELLKSQLMAPGVEESLPPSKDKARLLNIHVPERKNKRIKNQKGLFIYSGSVEHNFEECLSYTYGNIPFQFIKQPNPDIKEVILMSAIIKIVIPKELHLEILRYLRKIGISASMIYPDHFGLIQSLYEIETDRI